MGSVIRSMPDVRPLTVANGGTESITTVAAMTKLTGRNFSASNDAPGSPATGDLWWETDTNILWFWNGTYWLSEEVFTLRSFAAGITVNTLYGYFSPQNNSTMNDLYILSVTATMYVVTTNSHTQYWTAYWRWFTSANICTNVGTPSTIDNAANTWITETADIDTLYDVSALDLQGFDMTTVLTSTAGALYYGSTLSYRLAHL